MSAVCIPLLLTAVGAAIIERLLPDKDGGATGAARFVAGLCLLIALLQPLLNGISLLRALSASDGTSLAERLNSQWTQNAPSDQALGEENQAALFADQLAAMGKEQVEAWVSASLNDRFGIPPADAKVTAACTSDGSTVTLTDVWISLTGTAVFTNPHIIEDWFEERLNCPCRVSVG